MRTLAALSAGLLALALSTNALAQNNGGQGNNSKDKASGAVETQTIHGIIAGVTVEGELAVDYRTRRAAEADATFITVVGSPRHMEVKEGDKNAERSRSAGRHRHNVYIVWLSPRTEVRDSSMGEDKEQKAVVVNRDALEIGDRVEVQFTSREVPSAGAGGNANAQDQARDARHGRHRTFFGDANRITILSDSAHHDGKNPSKDDQSSEKGKSK